MKPNASSVWSLCPTLDSACMSAVETVSTMAVEPLCLQTVLRYFAPAGRQPVYLNELCVAARVSERTLHYVFQRQFGISPMKFLKLLRLHLLREILMTTSTENVSINEAALETGLWRLARYAQDYKKLFGELPSETARA